MRQKSELHDYQQDAITALYETPNLIAVIPMGGGKTISALTAIQEMLRDGVIEAAIVLAPKKVASKTWPDELLEWEHLQDLDVGFVTGTPANRSRVLNEQHEIYVVGIDNTQWLVEQIRTWDKNDPRFDLLVIDELTRYGSASGKRARELSFVADKFKNRWGLSGSPRPGNEERFYMMVRLIARKLIWPQPFEEWRMFYFMPEDPYTQLRWNIRDIHREEIWNAFGSVCFTVPGDRLPKKPELTTFVHWVDLPREARLAYSTMWRHLLAEVNGDVVAAVNRAVASGKLDQIAQGFLYKEEDPQPHWLHDEKLEVLKELVEGLGGEQAMITYWFKEDLRALQTVFGPDVPVLGSVTSEARAAAAIDRWNKRETQFILVHPASAGHGLNLQKGHAWQIIHYCLTWSPELLEQVRARLVRQGNKADAVMEHMILARNTTDDIKLERVTQGLETEQQFLDYLADLQARGGAAWLKDKP